MRNAFMFIIAQRKMSNTALFKGCLIVLFTLGAFKTIESALFHEPNLERLLLNFYKPILIMALLSLPVLVLLGVPYILALRKIEALNWITVCIGASIAGIIYTLVILIVTGLIDYLGFKILCFGAIHGLIAGLGFCIGAKFYSRSTLSSVETPAA